MRLNRLVTILFAFIFFTYIVNICNFMETNLGATRVDILRTIIHAMNTIGGKNINKFIREIYVRKFDFIFNTIDQNIFLNVKFGVCAYFITLLATTAIEIMMTLVVNNVIKFVKKLFCVLTTIRY